MTSALRERVSFWIDTWPDELVVAETLSELTSTAKADEIETLTRGQWRRMPSELGRLRAAYRSGKGAPGAFGVRALTFQLRLSPALGTAGGWETVGTLESSGGEDALRVLDALGAVAGTVERTDGSVAAFRRRATDLPALPDTGEPRGVWLWLEPLATAQLATWNRSLAHVLHGGAGGALPARRAASSRSAHASKPCHQEAEARPPALPSFMLPPATSAVDAVPSPAVGPRFDQRQPSAPAAVVGASSAPDRPAHPNPLASHAPIAPPVGGTEELDLAKLRHLVMANPIPFAGTTSPDRLAELRAAAEATDETVMAKVATGDEDADETMMLAPSAALRAQLAEPLPFEPAFPEVDVERYAAFVAELQVKGPQPDVLGRYRITRPAMLAALKTEQERRFAADPTLRARFEQRVAHYLSFMRPAGAR